MIATEKGNLLEEPVLKIIEEVNIEALKDLDSTQQEQLKAYLRIIANGDFK